MRVTSRDVARAAGVSQPTVSRALRDDRRLSASTRARVREVAAELGYVTAAAGRNLSTRATGQVAMVADLANPLYPFLVGPVHDELAEAGLRMVLLTERTDEDVLSRHLLDRSVDGVLLTTVTSGSRVPGELERRGVPFVMAHRTLDGVSADSVTADNQGGGAAVGDLLLRLGHRDVAALVGPSHASTSRGREQGFRDALALGGVELEPARVVRGGFGHADGVEGLAALLDAGPPPTAVFCVNDFVAVGVLSAALARGIRVPEDLTVIGFDDMPLSGWPAFALTTVDVPVGDIARSAARMLIARLRGEAPETPRHETQATSLVLRQTHGPQRG